MPDLDEQLEPYIRGMETWFRALFGSKASEFELDPPRGWKRTVVGLDRRPPRVSAYALSVDCCQAGLWGLAGRGVEWTVELGVTDENTYSTDSGVKFVSVNPVRLDATGAVALPLFSGHTWELTEQEREQSESGTVRHRFPVCVSCESLGTSREIVVMTTLTDKAGNVLMRFSVLSAPEVDIRRCCDKRE